MDGVAVVVVGSSSDSSKVGGAALPAALGILGGKPLDGGGGFAMALVLASSNVDWIVVSGGVCDGFGGIGFGRGGGGRFGSAVALAMAEGGVSAVTSRRKKVWSPAGAEA